MHQWKLTKNDVNAANYMRNRFLFNWPLLYISDKLPLKISYKLTCFLDDSALFIFCWFLLVIILCFSCWGSVDFCVIGSAGFEMVDALALWNAIVCFRTQKIDTSWHCLYNYDCIYTLLRLKISCINQNFINIELESHETLYVWPKAQTKIRLCNRFLFNPSYILVTTSTEELL